MLSAQHGKLSLPCERALFPLVENAAHAVFVELENGRQDFGMHGVEIVV